ncbi:MAG: N-6 DNA methylase [Bacteroidales bacterium]|nr:N-6 DNA methylase [Bacteroidales bacterium]
MVTNEPARVACGAPDYIITKRNIPVGYIEAKDIGADLHSKAHKEQFDRYKQSLGNLIITDYLTFELFREGEKVASIQIGEIQGNKIIGQSGNYNGFTALIKDFCTHTGQTIKSSSKLAKMMAGKARLMANIIEASLISDNQDQENSSLREQMDAFKQILIHDIKPKEFADIYAQTIAYGMFAARLHDTTLENFTRQEAAELIPKSNPFLRKLFQYIAGYDLDTRIVWIVDALAEIFSATNVGELLKDFGKATQQQDPIIHFYETFLSEYDPALRKSRGVWYTPEPVVNFIVRAVDDILKTEFDLKEGLADTSKTKIKIRDVSKATADLRSKTKVIEREEEVHRVQILDPATGTGTFLAEVVKLIHKKFKGQQGIWSNYVENHLLPRLNGFELLMASYAMAHLKLDMLLTESGYKPTKDQRFRIYLTNSLEEHHPDTGTLWANWLSAEANEANRIKRDTPVMCIIGNPPYSGESSNKGEWIMNLMEDYKKEPGGLERLNERNPKWINDDYVKFIRYGQHYIERNGSGILAFINPHGFLDNPTFRGMRWNLLKTYDRIYTLDLHGNAKKNETAPDGGVDINVFDIMQGVSINVFIKTGKKSKGELAKVYHSDLFGTRELKYEFLLKNSLNSILFQELPNIEPNYFFVIKDFDEQKVYDMGFKIDDIFNQSSVGVVTANDSVLVNNNRYDLIQNVKSVYQIEEDKNLIQKFDYRPFDNRFIYYDVNLIERSRAKLMHNFLKGPNIALLSCRQIAVNDWSHVGVTKLIPDDSRVSNRTKERGYVFPLYIYRAVDGQKFLDGTSTKIHNFNPKTIELLSNGLGLTFTTEKEITHDSYAPIDILDYIYAVLHSPTYREKYKEFLKIDFPRIPYPTNVNTFWQLVKLGGELRQIHLLEAPAVEEYITQYPEDGDNVVTKISYSDGKIFINDVQYFDNVPEVAWNFYIGGYQPAQKWLKDRKGRELSFEDISHYQKIIVALTETDRIMTEIDKIEFC